MSSQTINGVEYVIGKLNAFEQLHVGRKIGPLLSDLFSTFRSSPELMAEAGEQNSAESASEGKLEDKILDLVMGPFAERFASMDKDDVEYIINTCLGACERKQANNYAKVMTKGIMMFHDIEVDTMLTLTIAVITENLGRFFPTSQPSSVANQ